MAGIEVNRRTGNVRRAQIGAAAAVLLSLAAGGWTPAAASGPNIVEQWNKIAEDTVVATGAFQIEGFVYMSYTQTAVYDALVAIDGTYNPSVPRSRRPRAHRGRRRSSRPRTRRSRPTSRRRPVRSARRDHVARRDRRTDRPKTDGIAVGHQAAANIIAHADRRRPPDADRIYVVRSRPRHRDPACGA